MGPQEHHAVVLLRGCWTQADLLLLLPPKEGHGQVVCWLNQAAAAAAAAAHADQAAGQPQHAVLAVHQVAVPRLVAILG
jgi:hypothetical protein